MTFQLIFLGAQIFYVIVWVLLMRWGSRILKSQNELMKTANEGTDRAIKQWKESLHVVVLTHEALEKVTKKLQEKISN
jgi:hypothetical protein